jgi:hypothetical protein
MFSDIQHFHHEFSQLAAFKGAQEYENNFKKNFGFGLNTKIKANRVERYNPKNDFTIKPPSTYTDEVLAYFDEAELSSYFRTYSAVLAVWGALLCRARH